MLVKNAFLHFRKVITHRYWVRHYCFKIGLYKRGVLHDLSKYSPAEFIESARYYQGTKSPIDACKKKKGYSIAWLHHRGRNKHHWEYWVDNFQDGMKPIRMPFEYAAEMLCDFLGAGRAYMGDSYSFEREYQWWEKKREVVIMHRATKTFIDWCFDGIKIYGEDWLDKPTVHAVYAYSGLEGDDTHE